LATSLICFPSLLSPLPVSLLSAIPSYLVRGLSLELCFAVFTSSSTHPLHALLFSFYPL
jgi:hypothetical protein